MNDHISPVQRIDPGSITAVAEAPARSYRVRFLSKEFSHVGTPEFPYVPTRLTVSGIEYTAIVTTSEHPQDALSRNFPDSRITTIEENGDFMEDDAMNGHLVRGFVPAPTPRSFWQRVLRLR